MKIFIPVTPKAAPRPRFAKKGRPYNEEWYNTYRKEIEFYARRDLLAYGVTARIALTLTFRKPCDIDSPRFGDVDNLVKGVMDALNGVAWKDDRQVVELHAQKIFDSEAGIILDIQYLD